MNISHAFETGSQNIVARLKTSKLGELRYRLNVCLTRSFIAQFNQSFVYLNLFRQVPNGRSIFVHVIYWNWGSFVFIQLWWCHFYHDHFKDFIFNYHRCSPWHNLSKSYKVVQLVKIVKKSTGMQSNVFWLLFYLLSLFQKLL